MTPEQEKNILDGAREALRELRGKDYGTRRRGVMFVPTLLGHRLGPQQLREQPWGTVGQCENCDQIARAPREGESVEGRATYTICPAGR